MGTPVRVELWSADRAAAEEAMAEVMAEMHRIDRTMSPYKESSELSRINREAAARPVPVSEEMFRLLERAQACSELSDGAFDITYASVGHLYDYRLGTGPDEEALARGRAAVGYRHLVLDSLHRTVRFAREGVRIDLGGFAKGHAVDNCIALLKRRGFAHAMVCAGGDSHVMGDRRGRPWTIAIRHPRRAGEVVAVLPLEDVSISTSGDYERYFERDGVRFHHLIDPRSGRSPSEVRSVTILAPDGLTSEGWSKTVFVLGVERGLRLIESQPGVDAVVVDAQGVMHCTSGLLSQEAA
ncbi:FAD:protein FMN transferase [Schlegelella sp. S2-27]|uniref:FAD:protein FMN transferase n=1 Tax=Caldimonas mangrovi TaxID=2944811 RepID=A0ABT0YMK5_9BURK|nr:FAD:protein FMN transferase [Caldimonas mangrovi]MCM5679888.1 FAD:protein FMN transferase [Caldimonas mangrovi]